MWKKLASIVSAAITVSSCTTAVYTPIVCKPGTALREGKCQKVSGPMVEAPKAKAKYRSKKPEIGTGTVQPPRVYQNIY